VNQITNLFLPEPADPLLVKQIRRISKPMKLVSLVMLWGMIFFLALGLGAIFFYHGPLYRIDEGALYIFIAVSEVASQPNSVAISDLPLGTRVGMLVIGLLQYIPLVMVLAASHKLFARLKTQPIFAAEHAQILTNMGIWLIIFAVIPIFTDFIAAATGGVDRGWFHYTMIGEFLFGGLLIVLARIMHHASHLADEQRSIL